MVGLVETALPSWATFAPATQIFSIYSTNPADVGVYTLRVRGNLVTLSSQVDFTVNITGDCVLPTHAITSPVIPAQTYVISDPVLNVIAGPMTTAAWCAETFTYTGWLMVGAVETALPPWVTFNPATRTFSIYTTNDPDAGLHTLRLRGNLVTLSSQVDFTANLGVPCVLPTHAITNPAIANQTYNSSDPTLNVTAGPMTTAA